MVNIHKYGFYIILFFSVSILTSGFYPWFLKVPYFLYEGKKK